MKYISYSPKYQWLYGPTMPMIYGGMIGTWPACDKLDDELAMIGPEATHACLDWEAMTLRNQAPDIYASLVHAATNMLHHEVAIIQADILERCRAARPDLKWGVYNFPRCFYRKDGLQPPVHVPLLKMADWFAPSWYGLGENRYDALARCNRLDVEKAVIPFVKPSDPEPTITHIEWRQRNTRTKVVCVDI